MDTESRNPFIENYCRALIEKKGEKLDDEGKQKLVEDLYRLFENMLGRNMVAELPDQLRDEFVKKYDKGHRDVDYEEIAAVFAEHVSDPEEIMKRTLKEFSALYFKNR
jgi:hypothetical protein